MKDTKTSPACAHCYAETMAKRMGRKVFGQDVEWNEFPNVEGGDR